MIIGSRKPFPSSRPVLCLLLLFLCPVQLLGNGGYEPSSKQPPLPLREFRGAWIASVWNVDWPSKPGLSGAQQRAELIKILDLLAGLNMNAVILQVRPEGDALYRSELEPWSHWLSGQQGKPPSDGYDPLEFAVRESHARGLELHAWFNPFRARTSREVGTASNHITRRKPGLTMAAGTQVWLNPAHEEARSHVIRVMTDVARRYDVDGIHIDDYFYPYPKQTSSGMRMQFDDSASYQAYRRGGGTLAADAWRRAQINQFVLDLNRSLKEVKPWIKFGISPFGIWRPGHPEAVEASVDSYLHLAGDSRTWLREGWVDYLSPQLYWRINQKEQSFTALTQWWNSQNERQRHLWPGIASSRIQGEDSDRKRYASETVNQIAAVRKLAARQPGSGHIHWSVSALTGNRGGIQAQLRKSSYAQRALAPESPWLARGASGPKTPVLVAKSRGEGVQLQWLRSTADAGNVRWWVVQVREKAGSDWQVARVFPGEATGAVWNGRPDSLAVRAVDRAGRLSEAAVVVKEG